LLENELLEPIFIYFILPFFKDFIYLFDRAREHKLGEQ